MGNQALVEMCDFIARIYPTDTIETCEPGCAELLNRLVCDSGFNLSTVVADMQVDAVEINSLGLNMQIAGTDIFVFGESFYRFEGLLDYMRLIIEVRKYSHIKVHFGPRPE